MNTKGPWHINERAIGGFEVTALDSDDEGFFIESIATSHRADNARLIAAAPDLLLALSQLVEAVEKFTNADAFGWPELDEARKALRRAALPE